MKKLVLSLVLATGIAFTVQNVKAQNDEEKVAKQTTTENVRPGFVDNNGDGICDHFDGNRPGKGLGPGNGQGQGCRQGKGLGKRGNGHRHGRRGNGNYVDANNNGTCDNLENGSGRKRLQDGSGNGQGQPGNN